MKSLVLYRITSYIILIIGCYSGVNLLFSLAVAISNPSFLYQFFLALCIVLYTFSSYNFLRKGIDGKKKQSFWVRDFIRVNAFITAFLAVMMIFAGFIVIVSPEVLKQALSLMEKMQSDFKSTQNDFEKTFKYLMWFIFFYGLILVIHISMTFRLMKQYAHLFAEKKTDDTDSTGID